MGAQFTFTLREPPPTCYIVRAHVYLDTAGFNLVYEMDVYMKRIS